MFLNSHLFRKAVVAACAAALPLISHASAMDGTYYEFSKNNVDVNNGIDGGIVTGLVSTMLDANGLPTVTTFGATRTGGSGAITDVDSNGELQWWTVHPTVTFDKHDAADSLPFSFTSFYPSGQSNDSSYLRTAEFQGTFTSAANGSATFNVTSDDDAWVYVDGKLAVDDGGVHAAESASATLTGLTSGLHTVQLFYADRNVTDANLAFSSTADIQPAPEPFTMLFAAPAIVGIMRRRRSIRK